MDRLFLFYSDKEEAKHDPNLRHNALLVWAPVEEIPNSKCGCYYLIQSYSINDQKDMWGVDLLLTI